MLNGGAGVWQSQGELSDYGVDLSSSSNKLEGKIVLIKGHSNPTGYSVVSYARAAKNAYDNGAAAVIIYDDALSGDLSAITMGNSADTDYGDSWYDENCCPVIIISAEDGATLAAMSTSERTITLSFSSEEEEETSNSYYQMNSWSSWGVTPDLTLKPEITAPGGNIYSALPNDEYAYMSGTSMSAPQLTGVSAIMNQYVEEDEKFSTLTNDEKNDVVTQLLMSTATPLVDTTDLSSYYSPRKQGAGLVNAEAATTSDVYATVVNAENESRPKADLGESESGTWSFTVVLHNLGSTSHSFTLDSAALSEKVEDGLFQLSSKNWTNSGISVSYSDSSVVVPAGGTAEVTVTITCKSAFTAWAAANTPNGTFVDGFTFFNATDGGVDLSVPFMGFYGDWSDALALDGAADEDYHAFGTVLVNAETGYYLGVNPMDSSALSDISKVDMSKIVLSDSAFYGAPTSLTTFTGLLRGVASLTYEVTEGDESLGSFTYEYIPKSIWSSTYSQFLYAEAQNNVTGAPVLSGAEDEETVVLTETVVTAGPTPEEQSKEYEIQYDLTRPEITSVLYKDNDGDPTLTITVEDNTYLAAIDFGDPEDKSITAYNYFYRVLVDPDEALVGTTDDGKYIYEVTVSVASITKAWGSGSDIPSVVSAYAWDYGMNPSVKTDAALELIEATSVSIDAEEIDVAPGQELQLSATLAPANTTETKLVWSVEDESVATVDSDGVLTGVAVGSTKLTVAVYGHESVCDTRTVTVSVVGSDEGIRLSNTVKTVEKYGETEIAALLSPSLEGATVTWTSADTVTATVTAHEDDSTLATLAGAYQVGDTTVTATVTDTNGKTYSASMTVCNRPSNYDDFIIEDGVLTGYIGISAYVQIPNDVTEIADYAFQGDMIITQLAIPASVKKIGKYAVTRKISSTSTSYTATGEAKYLIFEDTDEHPSQLVEIGDYAFANGGVMGDIVLPDSVITMGVGVFESDLSVTSVHLSDSLTEIPDDTFNTCMLTTVEMSDKVTRIGTSAFKNALYLESIKIIGKEYQVGVIELPSALTEVGDSALAAAYLGSDSDTGVKVIIPSGLKSITSSTFNGCCYIVDVEIPEGVEYIGTNAFTQTSITSLTLPESLTELGYHAFFGMVYLDELTIGSQLGDGELEGAFGSYTSWLYPSGMTITKVNVPSNALYYSECDGAVFNKDMTRLVYYPAGLTGDNGSYTVPEGVLSLATGAFEDSALSELVLPDSLETVEKYALAAQFDVLDFGTNITSISENAFKQNFYSEDSYNTGYTPVHLIVRGGKNGSYVDTKYASSDKTAYFGEGMTSLSFKNSGAPSILVVPASLTSLDLSGNADSPTSFKVYAPADSQGWEVAKAALEAIGADPDTQLLPYTELTASYSLSNIDSDGTISLEGAYSGGVGSVSYRFVEIAADGTETVLSAWGKATSIDWSAPAGTTLRIDVRDATYLTASTKIASGNTEDPEDPEEPENPENPDDPSGDPENPDDPDDTSGDSDEPDDPSDTSADMSALQSFVDRVSGLSEDGYTASSWSNFAAALAAAQEVLADSSASQSAVNEALSALQSAYAALEAAEESHASLEDGTYDVKVSMRSYLGVSSESMAAALLDENAELSIEDGVYTLTVNLLQGASVMGYEAYLSNIVYYPDGCTVASDGSVSRVGSPSSVRVLETDENGYPTKVSFVLSDSAKSDGYTLMYGAFASMGSQYFVVALDWDAFDAAYGPETPESETADKDALAALLESAAGMAQGSAADVDYAVFQAAVAAAQAVCDDDSASQTDVDAQVVALAAAIARFNGEADFSFVVGGVYRIPITWVNAQGTQVGNDFFSPTVEVTVLEDGSYQITLSVAEGTAASISNVTYGANATAAQSASGSELSFVLEASSLTEALAVAYQVSYGSLSANQSAYILFDTSLVEVVSEPDEPEDTEAETECLVRLGGMNRYATMALVSQAAFADGECDTVIVCRGNNFPDALAAAGLAGVLEGQVLLTKTSSLTEATAEEIVRLGASTVYVIGDESSVSADVVASIEALDGVCSVTRVAGKNRYATAVAVYEAAEASEWGDTCIVATGTKAADALSVSAVAYAEKAPIFLANKSGSLSADALVAIEEGGFSTVLVLGDTNSVSAATEKTLASYGLSVERLEGSNRYKTSAAIAEWAIANLGFNCSSVAVTAGNNGKYADALVASALCGKAQSPVLLVNSTATTADVVTDLLAAHTDEIENVYVLGSEESVTAALYSAIGKAIS